MFLVRTTIFVSLIGSNFGSIFGVVLNLISSYFVSLYWVPKWPKTFPADSQRIGSRSKYIGIYLRLPFGF